MQETGFVTKIRELRQAELQRRVNLSEQSMVFLNSYLRDIEQLPISPERKLAKVQKAMRLYKLYMERDVPAEG